MCGININVAQGRILTYVHLGLNPPPPIFFKWVAVGCASPTCRPYICVHWCAMSIAASHISAHSAAVYSWCHRKGPQRVGGTLRFYSTTVARWCKSTGKSTSITGCLDDWHAWIGSKAASVYMFMLCVTKCWMVNVVWPMHRPWPLLCMMQCQQVLIYLKVWSKALSIMHTQ